MSFLEHLEELRWTLVKCVAAFLFACLLVGVFLTQSAALLRWPFTFAAAGRDSLLGTGELVTTSFFGSFSVVIYVLLVGGFALSLPFMLVFIGRFVAPGLTRRERRLLFPACLAGTGLFALGSSFSFFVLLPAALRAAFYLNELLGFTFLLTAASYYQLLAWAVLGVGLAFQFPLVLMLLIYLELVSTAQLRAWRRYAVVAFLALSAVVTPTPDPVSFLFLAVPLYGLYELSILCGARVERWRRNLPADENEGA